MARELIRSIPGVIHLDLQKPSDLARLSDPQYFMELNRGRLICLDEIQRKPDLFPLLRSLVDEWGGNGHFLLLGSASRDLLRQSSESLAGRISYKELTPFLFDEVAEQSQIESYMLRGGFPRSLLARTDPASFSWRQDFIGTYLERDLFQWSGFLPATMRRLWQMLAHLNGQLINYSSLGAALGVSSPTIRRYIDLLADTYMVKTVQPYLPNLGKRLVRSPRVYLTDTGLAAALLDIRTFSHWMGHPSFGSAWEAMVLTQLSGHFPMEKIFFYRSSQGAELDFILESGDKRMGVECKASLAPVLTKGNHQAISDVAPGETLIISPVKEGWRVKPGIRVVSLRELPDSIAAFFR